MTEQKTKKDFQIGYVDSGLLGDELKVPNKNFEGKRLGRKSVTGDKIQGFETDTVDTDAIQAGAVTASKVSYEVVTVTITAGNSSGTAAATSGDVIVGCYPDTNCDQIIKNVSISGTTVTVNLLSNSTGTSTIKVFLLKA